ncbi:hypothetical protein Q3G72_010078 [Acer saccharum]|nr:hypothetical protein Q3G72_010078 [Acer saccharum]
MSQVYNLKLKTPAQYNISYLVRHWQDKVLEIIKLLLSERPNCNAKMDINAMNGGGGLTQSTNIGMKKKKIRSGRRIRGTPDREEEDQINGEDEEQIGELPASEPERCRRHRLLQEVWKKKNK